MALGFVMVVGIVLVLWDPDGTILWSSRASAGDARTVTYAAVVSGLQGTGDLAQVPQGKKG